LAIGLIAGSVVSCVSLREFYSSQITLTLDSILQVGQDKIIDAVKTGNKASLATACSELGERSQSRITLVNPSGEVLCETGRSMIGMENHAARPEIRDAMATGTGSAVRYSQSTDTTRLYTARRLVADGNDLGVLRASRPHDAIDDTLSWVYLEIFGGFLVLFLVVAVITFRVTKRIVRPIGIVQKHLEKMSAGDFSSQSVYIDSDPEEIAALGKAINDIQTQLDDRMKKITQQKREKEGIFSSIFEGVIAIDETGRIISINYAAYHMLGLPDRRLKGEVLADNIANEDLHNFIMKSLKDPNRHELEIQISGVSGIRILIVKAAPLRIQDGQTGGAVFVIDDVTRVRNLENLRREFVANVSHELRTPLTTIQGFAETLLNPSVNSDCDRDDYIRIILKNSNRIAMIIDDLLTLSKLEQDGDETEVATSPNPLLPVIESAIDSCRAKAEVHNISLVLVERSGVVVSVNSSLFEQAIVNLLDNSIKYSEDGSKVEVALKSTSEFAVVEVKDYGIGIPPELLPRLFERFYRVDKARSRKMGGTGLGLSIVKHIVQAHRGRVEVESEVGQGSQFRILLPL
jgi:two-component system phosphate regulon sensor histidine kinase PhoR